MKRDKNKRLVALIVLAFLALASMRTALGIRDWTKVAIMTRNMKTVCVGRFLIDLPANARVSYGPAFLEGFDISSRDEGDAEFDARVAAREQLLRQRTNDLGKPSLESVRAYRSGKYSGRIFVYGRWRTSWTENGEPTQLEGVVIEGMLHGEGASFTFLNEQYDPAKVGRLAKLFEQFSARADGDIPSGPGFCIGRGFIREPLQADQNESVALLAGLPDHPDVTITFSSMVGTTPAPGILERSAEAIASYPMLFRPAVKILREGVRTVGGLAGEEIGAKITEPNFVTTFTYDWEMRARENEVLAPLLALQLQTGVPRPGGRPLQSSLAEGAIDELWESIVPSIRVRPFMTATAAPTQAPSAPLGTYASAGDACPATGWWQCNEGGNGVAVLGGQRQFIRKGQRMPQALLMPQATLWDKVRGVQPSFESVAPTGWKLVDKRARGRGVSTTLLAPAGPVQPDRTAAGASLGSVARTGEPCPASGWWRCEDAQALDGTRWFGHGSVLPAATFDMPPAWFGKNGGGPPVIQRRSNWTLVRPAAVPQAEGVVEEDPAG
jgi:hypothetical protein